MQPASNSSDPGRGPGPAAGLAPQVGMLVGAMISIQAGASFASGLFPLVGPAGASALRLAFGTLILAVALQPWKARRTRSALVSVLAYGVVLGGMNLCFYQALARIPLGVAVALEFTGPLALAAFSSRKPLDFFWVALALGGLLLLTPFAGASALDPLGMGFALAAGAFWAAYIVAGRRAGAEQGARATALGCAVAALVVIPFGVVQAGPGLLNPALILPGLMIALLSTAVPYTLEMIVMGRMPVRVFGVLMSLEPAIGALAGWLFLRQTLSGAQMLAVAAIIAASAGVAYTAGRPVPDL